MSEARTPRLPLLTGSRNVPTGSYVAEQIDPSSYDLVALNAKPRLQRWGRSGGLRNLKKSRADKLFKCTQLRALEDIDGLFTSEGGHIADNGSTEDARNDIPAVAPLSFEEDSDEDFRSWLKLPSTSNLDNKAKDWAQDKKWHLLLSHKSFRSYSDQHVANCLVYALDIDRAAADEKVAKARRHRFVVLDDFEEKSDAFKKLQQLRSGGLQVQVTMDSGLPGDRQEGYYGRPSKQEPAAHKRSYTDFFFKAGADKSSGNRHIPVSPHPMLLHCSGLEQWRTAQGADFDMKVIVEDPVGALFDETTGNPVAYKKKKLALLPSIATKQRGPDVSTPASPRSSPRKHTMKIPVDVIRSEEGGAIPDAEIAKPKDASPVRKEACMLMRFFVFGYFGNEDAATTKEIESVFREVIGTREQVHELHKIWCVIDHDGSGRVDYSEFKAFAEVHIRNKMKSVGLMQKNINKAVTRHRTMQKIQEIFDHALEDYPKFIESLHLKLGTALLGKKSSFSLEEMMRLLWLGARQPEVKVMHGWCREFTEEASRNRVPTPPELDAVEYEGLCAVFEYFDENRNGEIEFDKLVTKGLIYAEQVDEYRKLWDANCDGMLSLQEFCEMMCPVGYRATNKSHVGFMPDGRRVVRDASFEGWKIEDTHMDRLMIEQVMLDTADLE